MFPTCEETKINSKIIPDFNTSTPQILNGLSPSSKKYGLVQKKENPVLARQHPARNHVMLDQTTSNLESSPTIKMDTAQKP